MGDLPLHKGETNFCVNRNIIPNIFPQGICIFQKYLYICNHYKLIRIIMKNTLLSIWNFYADGFRNMTWGRPLWILIFLKVIVLFLVLRMFFFEPVLSGKTEEQKIEHVGKELMR